MIAALAGGAVAAEPKSEDAGLLRGPKVIDASGPDAGDSMSGSREASNRAGDMPLRAYLGAVRGLNKAAKDNPELALTDDQKEQIKEIAKSHKEKMDAFMEANKDEVEQARGQRGQRDGENAEEQNRERGDRKAKGERKQLDGKQREGGNDRQLQRQRSGDELGEEKRARQGERPSPEQQQRMREKRAEFMSKAPSDQAAKKQLWAVLTPAQQVVVKENVTKMRQQRQERIDKAMEGQGKGKGEGKAKSKGERKLKGKPEQEGMIPDQSPIFEIDQPVTALEDC